MSECTVFSLLLPVIDTLAWVGSEGLLRRMESAVLDVLNWEMYVTTSAHFLETYIGITSGATFPEDIFDGQP